MANDRDLTSEFETALLAGTVYPFLAAEIGTGSGPFRCWTGIGEIEIGGETYYGAGDAASASPFEETTDIYAAGMTLQLTNISDAHLAILLGDMEQGQTATLYLGLLSSTGTLIGTMILFRGLTDVPSLSMLAERITASISVESRLVRLLKSPDIFYTPECQKARHPTDKGFDFVNILQNAEIKWGKGGNSTSLNPYAGWASTTL